MMPQPLPKKSIGHGVSTIRVSGRVKHALNSVEVRFNPPANAGGTDLIATPPPLLRQSHSVRAYRLGIDPVRFVPL